MYLEFFESKGHLKMNSFSLVPHNDNSLLLINAGMAPLKPYFTGQEIPPRRRVTTCQKCIRTGDIENVGKTARHLTFFEMLGNFSFGDYFKHEAIAWSWEFLTKVLGLEEDRLYPSIYGEDDEAFAIWNKEVGVPAERITRFYRDPETGACNVGKTARHLTFFEMLGNFSFGDYFKHEAIAWSWEFLTKVLGLEEDRLYPSIYGEDDEAFAIWNKEVGVPAERITRFYRDPETGACDNFWEHGAGPCGPCSEIYYDRGEKYGCGSPDCKVGCECDRFMEVWNNVFTQFNGDGKGGYEELEQKNIDTGMGLERLAVVMQDVDSVFDIDTMKAIRDKVCALCGKTYQRDALDDVSIRLITDHIRSATFMVSDGIMPSNEGSEIYYDRGEKYGCGSPDCKVGCECDRFMEVWNNVFTQFNGDGKGGYEELEQKNIDTGMGLERLAVVMQDVDSVFDIDTMKAIRDKVCALCGKTYQKDALDDVSIRLITDHIRSATFMVSDGIMPSNEGRGYVLRRIIRRAARHGRMLGIEGCFMAELAATVIAESKDGYPELEEKQDFIFKVLTQEEEKFGRTIDQGLSILAEMQTKLEEKGEKPSGDGGAEKYCACCPQGHKLHGGRCDSV